jgi:hypothetical protein
MIQLCVIIVSGVAVITGIFSVLWGWIILCFPIIFVLITLLTVKVKKWKHIPELSERANKLFQKYGHYYTMPFAGRDFSSSASTLMFAGAAIAIIGAFKGFYWGIGLGIINWLVMGFVAKAFNPTIFLTDPLDKMAHEDIITYIKQKMLM